MLYIIRFECQCQWVKVKVTSFEGRIKVNYHDPLLSCNLCVRWMKKSVWTGMLFHWTVMSFCSGERTSMRRFVGIFLYQVKNDVVVTAIFCSFLFAFINNLEVSKNKFTVFLCVSSSNSLFFHFCAQFRE